MGQNVAHTNTSHCCLIGAYPTAMCSVLGTVPHTVPVPHTKALPKLGNIDTNTDFLIILLLLSMTQW